MRIPCHILCQISFHAAAMNWKRRCLMKSQWTSCVTVWSLMSRCWKMKRMELEEVPGPGLCDYRCKVILQRSRGCVCMLGVYVCEWATEWLSGMESERSSVSNLKFWHKREPTKTLFQCRYSTPVSHLVCWLHSAMLAWWWDVGKGWPGRTQTWEKLDAQVGVHKRFAQGLTQSCAQVYCKCWT